jgi:hypothetical protein
MWSYAGQGPSGGNPGVSPGGRTTPPTCGWNSAMHKYKGNVALGDGSIQQITSAALVSALKSSVETNRYHLFPIKSPGEN